MNNIIFGLNARFFNRIYFAVFVVLSGWYCTIRVVGNTSIATSCTNLLLETNRIFLMNLNSSPAYETLAYQEEIHAKMENLNFVQMSTKIEIIRRLSLAEEYINNNYDRKFGLGDIASESCLSVNHLLRTFKQAYGISPFQYLTFVRLNKSRILLEAGQYSVNEIAFLVGFESVSSFIRLFKATFSYTPLKFKKSTNNNKSIVSVPI